MIAIIDYGMGNLRSVQKAFEQLGHQATITRDPGEVSAATRVVLPGVGAFADAIAAIHAQGLADPIRSYIASGRPFLGICLGLQLLFEVGNEDGRHEGLGVLAGECRRFNLPQGYKVPHMGWNGIEIVRPSPLYRDIEPGTHVYFVHSYFAEPSDPAVVATTTDYGGPFTSSVWRDNLFATQFHPEKSQAAGLRMLKNFAEL